MFFQTSVAKQKRNGLSPSPADKLTRGPYLESCWRSSFQRREQCIEIIDPGPDDPGCPHSYCRHVARLRYWLDLEGVRYCARAGPFAGARTTAVGYLLVVASWAWPSPPAGVV